jgi:hypothetical protein
LFQWIDLCRLYISPHSDRYFSSKSSFTDLVSENFSCHGCGLPL